MKRGEVSPMRRAAAGVAALAATAPLLFVAFVTLIGPGSYINRPDPSVRDGDPCCAYPDTWGQVALGVAAVLLGWLIAAAIAVGLWWLARVAVTGNTRRPRLRPRTVLLGMLGSVGLVALYVGVITVASPLWN